MFPFYETRITKLLLPHTKERLVNSLQHRLICAVLNRQRNPIRSNCVLLRCSDFIYSLEMGTSLFRGNTACLTLIL